MYRLTMYKFFKFVSNIFHSDEYIPIVKQPKREFVYGKYHRCRITIKKICSDNPLILFSGYKTMNSDTTFIVSSYYIHSHRNKIESADVSPIIRNRMAKWYEN